MTNKKKYNHRNLIHHSTVGTLLLLEIVFGIALSVLSFYIFMKIRSEIFEKELTQFDTTVSFFFYALRRPWLTYIMLIISFMGDYFVVIASIITALLLFFKNHKRGAFLFFSIVIMSVIIDSLLKNLIQRPRPTFSPLIIEHSYSFPSGHSMNSFVFYSLLAYMVYHYTKNITLTFFAFLIADVIILLIGISRIYLGVHYPTDVIAGFVAGFWWFVTVMLIDRTLIFYNVWRQKNISMKKR